jgi:hypothetical protein
LFIIASILSGTVSIGCLIGGACAVFRQLRSRKGSLSAAGKVVGLEKRIFNPGSSGVYCPVVEFTDAFGGTHRFESSFGTMPASNAVGDSVRVYYDPASPAGAEIDSGISKYFIPGCLFLFSAGSCFLSLMFMGLFLVYQNM